MPPPLGVLLSCWNISLSYATSSGCHHAETSLPILSTNGTRVVAFLSPLPPKSSPRYLWAHANKMPRKSSSLLMNTCLWNKKKTHISTVCTLRDEPSFASHLVASINDKSNGHIPSPLWASLPPSEQRQWPFPEWTVMALAIKKQLEHSGTQLEVRPLLCPKMSVVLGDCLPEDERQICF